MKIQNKLKATLVVILFIALKTQAQVTINFMTFNIWQEGTSVSNGLNKIRDIIIESDPDIVGFTEVRNYNEQDWTTKIINKLSASGISYHRGYAGGDVSIISKFPIIESALIFKGEGSVASFRVVLTSDTIIVACAHLDYTYYACYLPRGYHGGSPNWKMIDDGTGNPAPVTDINQILAYNLLSTRDEQTAAFLNSIQDKTEPVILMGDFNEPSYRDWSEKTGSMFDHHGLVIPWQNTLLLAENGFRDSFRDFFPNEADNPGITWPSYAHGIASTSWTPLADERDRIDYIFYKGRNIQTTYAALVGPKESYSHNKLTTTFTSNENFIADTLEWPSDHKAVMASLTFPNTSNMNSGSCRRPKYKFTLNNNFPNPFNASTTISYSLFQPSFVKLVIFDIQGREVKTLVNEFQAANTYFAHFDANPNASGVYFYKLYIGNMVVKTKKMLLMK